MDSDPTLVAGIIFSDSVIVEQGTGKQTIVGMFSTWNSSSFPSNVGPFWITLLITNLESEMELKLVIRVEDNQSLHVLSSSDGTLRIGKDFKSRNGVIGISLPIKPFMVQQPADYVVKIFGNAEQIGMRTLTVQAMGSAGQKQMEG